MGGRGREVLVGKGVVLEGRQNNREWVGGGGRFWWGRVVCWKGDRTTGSGWEGEGGFGGEGWCAGRETEQQGVGGRGREVLVGKGGVLEGRQNNS